MCSGIQCQKIVTDCQGPCMNELQGFAYNCHLYWDTGMGLCVHVRETTSFATESKTASPQTTALYGNKAPSPTDHKSDSHEHCVAKDARTILRRWRQAEHEAQRTPRDVYCVMFGVEEFRPIQGPQARDNW